MRTIHVDKISEIVKDMCIKANHKLSEDMKCALIKSEQEETSELGKQVLEQLLLNLEIADTDNIPICQDTGMAVIFIEIGQEVYIEGGSLEKAINLGVKLGYEQGFLRKSVVTDPIIRVNSKDNTPAVIHYTIVDGDKLKIKVAPKGFGSENMSKIIMLKPSDGVEGIKNAVLSTVKEAGPNACPPMVVGVGIGGTFEKCAIMAKEALSRDVSKHSDIPHIKQLEEELLEEINKLGIGPGGLGGKTTAFAVNIETYPTHIAGLPIAINICCHVNRHIIEII
ncbi:MAG: fumarate hydratase [Lachnospiraceae bacterium]